MNGRNVLQPLCVKRNKQRVLHLKPVAHTSDGGFYRKERIRNPRRSDPTNPQVGLGLSSSGSDLIYRFIFINVAKGRI